jgi:hypothetical protein
MLSGDFVGYIKILIKCIKEIRVLPPNDVLEL